MTTYDILLWRMHNQYISRPAASIPELIKHLGAMQAQDYPGALWSVALRLPDATVADVEHAIAQKQIVRTWPMRGTLHFVPAEDAKWMVGLMAPKVISGTAARRRQLEIDDDLVAICDRFVTEALHGGNQMTRAELLELLEKHGVRTQNQRGTHILWELAANARICFGPHQGKQPTFVLLDEWVPQSVSMDAEAGYAEMARRYFTSHGPTTIDNFVAWTRCKVSEAKAALAAVADELEHFAFEGKEYWMPKGSTKPTPKPGTTCLLPGFDEYLLGYRDRSAALKQEHSNIIVPGGNGMFLPTLVIDGTVRGKWRRTQNAKKVTVTVTPFEPLTPKEIDAIHVPLQRYSAYLGLPANLVITE